LARAKSAAYLSTGRSVVRQDVAGTRRRVKPDAYVAQTLLRAPRALVFSKTRSVSISSLKPSISGVLGDGLDAREAHIAYALR